MFLLSSKLNNSISAAGSYKRVRPSDTMVALLHRLISHSCYLQSLHLTF